MKIFGRKEKKEKDPNRVITFAEVKARFRRSVLIIMVLIILVVLLFELPIKAQAIFANDPRLFWIGSLVAGAIFILITRWLDKDNTIRQFPPPERMRCLLIVGAVGGLALLAWFLVGNALLQVVFPGTYAGLSSASSLYTGSQLPLAILGGALILPIGHELIFRGYLLHIIRERRSNVPSIVLCALLYGLRSLDPFQLMVNVGAGIALGVLTVRYHLFAAITAHIAANGLLLFLLTLS